MLTKLIDDFIEWHQKNKEELEHVATLLSQPLPDDPNELLGVLGQIEAWNSRIGYLFAEANAYLEKFRYAYLTSKEDSTETERKVKLDFDTADYRLVRNKIEILLDSIKQRLILGESALAYYRSYHLSSGEAKKEKMF